MKKIPWATTGTSDAPMRDAARVIGLLSIKHGFEDVQQSLRAVCSVELPGFRRRTLLAAMIANLANRKQHAAPVILTGTGDVISDELAEIVAPQIEIAKIASILKTPVKTKPPKTSVLSVRLEDATRLLFASMDEEEEPVVPQRTPKPEPQVEEIEASPQMLQPDVAHEAETAPVPPETLPKTAVPKPRKARVSAKKPGLV